MVRVLYVVSTLKRSGPTSQLYNVINDLDRSRFEPHLITLSPESEASDWEQFAQIGVKLYSLNLSRLHGFFLSKYKLNNLIKKIKPDLIHTQGIRADVLASSLKIKIPKVTTIHNYPQEDYLMTYGSFQGKIMLKKHISAFKKLDLCLCVSGSVERNINKVFLVDNTYAIPNGVKTDIFFPVGVGNKKIKRDELNLPSVSKIWISSGHLSSRKDPMFLIQQWKKIYPNDRLNILLFVGGGELEPVCRGAAEGLENIIIKGRVSNVADYLQASDYYISASKAEGLPMAAIEALSVGLPCFLSDIAPHQEIVTMDEAIGCLFGLGDPESFKANLKRLQSLEYSIMREAALKLTVTNLSAKTMSNSYQVQYEKLIANNL